jgi:hypothetical protein
MAVAVATDNTSHSVDVKMNTSEAAPLTEVTCTHASFCVVRLLVKQTERRTVVTAILCGWHHGFVDLQNEKQKQKSNRNVAPTESHGLQHCCVGRNAPDGSAFNYSARTDNMKVALMAAVECLPSKLPSWAATDVSGSCTNAGTRTNAIGNQSARTQL